MKTVRRLLLLLVAASLVAMTALTACAQDAELDPAVEQGREALSSRGQMPWYDSQKDDIRALNLPPEENDFDNRKSRWSSNATPTTTNTNTNARSFSELLWGIVQIIFWVLVVVILAGLVYLLVRAFINREDQIAQTTSITFEADTDDEERIASLPFEMARPRGDLLDEARAQYDAGNFRLAVIYLFSHLLITLDKHQLIRLAKGKTNRQYLRELRSRPELKSILEQTMIPFEDVFFGNHTLDREEFEACWQQLDRFHHHVDQVPEAV